MLERTDKVKRNVLQSSGVQAQFAFVGAQHCCAPIMQMRVPLQFEGEFLASISDIVSV
jgi:hypothetical protein